MMNNHQTIEILRARARAIRPVISPILHQAVIAEVSHHRERILSSCDQKEINDYINRATDSECLCALSEMYLNAPLNDTYYHLFAYLVVSVFTQVGIDVPKDIQAADRAPLNETEQHELESLRRGIRKTQKRTTPRGGH